MSRKKIPVDTEMQVLTSSRRRCCICFGLFRDVQVKAGQIAHLDRDSTNAALDNLAFLCFEHHDRYDSKTSQSKNFSIAEVKAYRDELYRGVLPLLEKSPTQHSPPLPLPVSPDYQTHKSDEKKQILKELLADRGPVNSITYLAHHLRVTTALADQLLYELAQQGVVRIDRDRGIPRKTYSLAASIENRLIDTFSASLQGDVSVERRHIRQRNYDLDAFFETSSGATYAIETFFARERITSRAIKSKINRLDKAKTAMGLNDAISVLLIGIAENTVRENVDIKQVEQRGVLIRFIEVP
jgi:hypothetical protein